MWDLWWTKWHLDRFFPEYFGFSLAISFHRCSIKMERQKNKTSSSPQGCTMILKAAVRPYHLLRGPSPQKKTPNLFYWHGQIHKYVNKIFLFSSFFLILTYFYLLTPGVEVTFDRTQ
jgi:hypothetical protein